MNLDRPEIRTLEVQDMVLYSIEDSLKIYAPESKWPDKPTVVVRKGHSKDHYADAKEIIDFIKKSKP